MSEAGWAVRALFVTNSPGPEVGVTAQVELQTGSVLPPLLVEDPAPQLSGSWRRVSGPGQTATYVRLSRIAAP